MKVLELFGGIGACSKALERLGIEYEIADYVEIDKYAVKSFNAIHDTNFEPQDICTWDKDIEVDLIMHGSPCQDFSLAGKQAGGNKGSGTRSSLMYETIRIVEKLKPKYVIWENVKNLLSKKHIHNFNAYLETMEQLGYQNYHQVLNAKDYGIPQNRERVFTISILGTNNYEFPQPQKLKLKLKDMLEDGVDEKYYLSDKNIDNYAVAMRGRYNENGKVEQQIEISNREESNAITTVQKDSMVTDNLRIRKLTPKECWRLMGFDDEDFEKASKVNSNTQLYKQAGNSIVVNVLEATLTNLLLNNEQIKIEKQMTIYDYIAG